MVKRMDYLVPCGHQYEHIACIITWALFCCSHLMCGLPINSLFDSFTPSLDKFSSSFAANKLENRS